MSAVKAVMRLTKTDEGLIFMLRIGASVPERTVDKIPKRLWEAPPGSYIRILSVSGKKATLGLFPSKEMAEEGLMVPGDSLLPEVTGPTMSYLGITYVDGQGWVYPANDTSESEELEKEAAQEQAELKEEADRLRNTRHEEYERESAAAEEEAAAAAALLGVAEVQTILPQDQGIRSENAIERAIREATGISNKDAVSRLIASGLAELGSLEVLRVSGVEFATRVGQEAGLSMFEMQRLVNFASAWSAAEQEATPRQRIAVPREPRNAALEAARRISWLASIKDDAHQSDSESVDEELEATPKAEERALRQRKDEAHRKRKEEVAAATEEAAAESRRKAATAAMAMATATARAEAKAASTAMEMACAADEAERARVAGEALARLRAVSSAGGGEEVANLLRGVHAAAREQTSIFCVKVLMPALTSREPREVELMRPQAALGSLLRILAEKGERFEVTAPGDDGNVMDAVQDTCLRMEMASKEARPQGAAEQSAAGAMPDFHAVMIGGGGGSASGEKLEDERALMDALMHIHANPSEGAKLEELAKRRPGDKGLMRAAAQLGGHEKMRALLYGQSIHLPSGTLATPTYMSIISAAKRLRALLAGQHAEDLRPLLPSAGTKDGLAIQLAESMLCGHVLKFKPLKIFQPEGGSFLTTGGGKKEKEQSPSELFARGVNLLSFAYQNAHGSIDSTICSSFARILSDFLDLTQKGVEAGIAAGLVLEPLLGELDRQWRRAASGMGEVPTVGDVADTLRPRQLAAMSVALAGAAREAQQPEKEKRGGKEVETLQKSLKAMKEQLSALKAGKGGAKGGKSGKETAWNQSISEWEAVPENKGLCWFVHNHYESCVKGKRCRHYKTQPDHPEAPEK